MTNQRKEVKMAINSEKSYINDVLQRLKDLGYKPLEEQYYQNIYIWLDWYKGYVKDFHSYRMFNGVKFVDMKISELGLAKAFAERWASLLFNDKTYINMDEDKDKLDDEKSSQNILDKVIKETNFRPQFRNTLEMVFALGTGATVEYKEGDEVRINHIYAPMIFPLKQINGEIESCAFASIDGDGYYLNIHEKQTDGTYLIRNDFFKTQSLKDKVQTESMEEERNIVPEYVSPVKMFQIYKPNQVNKLDLYCPMGMSIYANTIDQFKLADYAYDSFLNEFRLGKKKIYIPLDTLTYKVVIDDKGQEQSVPIFDSEQSEYYALPANNDQEIQKEMIHEYNPQLRVEDHLTGLQLAINLAGMNAGFGENYFTFKDGKVYTNTTQVISSNSEMYKNIKKQEDMLQIGLVELARALYYLETGTEYDGDISIDFDDSIIEDSQAKRNDAILELNNGLIDPVQYYQDIYGMTKQQAIEFREEIKQRLSEEEASNNENNALQGEEIDEEDNESNSLENTQDEEENGQFEEDTEDNPEEIEETEDSEEESEVLEEEEDKKKKKKLPFKK